MKIFCFFSFVVIVFVLCVGWCVNMKFVVDGMILKLSVLSVCVSCVWLLIMCW